MRSNELNEGDNTRTTPWRQINMHLFPSSRPFPPPSQLLREGFEREVLLRGEEVEANAREKLEDIESQGRGCRPGAYGRKLQFADPDFPPDNSSVGNAQCRQELASQWKVSWV